jgi:hypothetical protein
MPAGGARRPRAGSGSARQLADVSRKIGMAHGDRTIYQRNGNIRSPSGKLHQRRKLDQTERRHNLVTEHKCLNLSRSYARNTHLDKSLPHRRRNECLNNDFLSSAIWSG